MIHLGPEYWEHLNKAEQWLNEGKIDKEGFEFLTNMAGDIRWNDIANQLVNEKKDTNENKSKDEKCTCPTHKLTQQGCPRLRGEEQCSKD